jgi:hypothetical protein
MSDEPTSDVPVVLVSCDVGIAAAELFLELERVVGAKIPAERAADTVKLERQRLLLVLKAFSEFIGRASPVERRTVRSYLFNVAAALDQLNDGTVHPVFQPKTRRGPKDDRVDIWHGRMRVCLALHCYEHDGRSKSRNELAAWIAQKNPTFKQLMRSGTGKTGLAGAIVSWHRAFQQGKANTLTQEIWEKHLKEIEELCRANPAEYARTAEAQLDMAIKAVAALAA